MLTESAIEWTDTTWNPVRGCVKVSPGCKHCYAEAFAERFRGVKGHPYEQGFDLRLVPEKLEEPLRKRKPSRIFVNSMSDLFQDGVPDEYIDRVFAIMSLAKHHTFQVLTKRARRMREYLSGERRRLTIDGRIWEQLGRGRARKIKHGGNWQCQWPLPNVWLGVSVENQEAADERILELLGTPAAIRFLSVEPLLGPIDFAPKADSIYRMLSRWYGPNGFDETGSQPVAERRSGLFPNVDWVIVGGESGPGARPMHPEWARSIRDQCQKVSVPFFFKQWGEWSLDYPGGHMEHRYVQRGGPNVVISTEPTALMYRVGKKLAGRMLDRRTWDEMPEVRNG